MEEIWKCDKCGHEGGNTVGHSIIHENCGGQFCLTTDQTPRAEVALDCGVKILATELAETWWTAVYFERDNMSSFDAEKAGEVKATTEYEHFIPQAKKLLERIKF